MFIYGGFNDRYLNEILIYNFSSKIFTKIKSQGQTPPALSNMQCELG